MVSEIQDNIDHVIELKNNFELEGEISCRHSQFKFLNRSVPIFSVEDYNIPQKAKDKLKNKAPCNEVSSGIVIAMVFDGNTILTFKININILYSDNRRSHCSSSLCQRQLGKLNLLGYANKTLPKACLNYSVTE